MQTIQNKTTSIPLEKPDQGFHDTASLLRIVLNQPPAHGFDISAIRARLRIAAALDAAKTGEPIALEDADYAAAKECVAAYRWGAWHSDLVRFAEQFGL